MAPRRHPTGATPELTAAADVGQAAGLLVAQRRDIALLADRAEAGKRRAAWEHQVMTLLRHLHDGAGGAVPAPPRQPPATVLLPECGMRCFRDHVRPGSKPVRSIGWTTDILGGRLAVGVNNSAVIVNGRSYQPNHVLAMLSLLTVAYVQASEYRCCSKSECTCRPDCECDCAGCRC